MPILSKKRPFSQKHCALMSIKKNMKNPLLSCPYLIKKRQFCQNNTILWAKEVSMMPFFFRFLTKKSSLLCPYFVKKRPFSKKHNALKSIFCQKNVHSLKNTVLLCHFFKIFMKNPLLSRPYLVKKRQFSQKYIIIWPNKSIGCPFFRFFTKK